MEWQAEEVVLAKLDLVKNESTVINTNKYYHKPTGSLF